MAVGDRRRRWGSCARWRDRLLRREESSGAMELEARGGEGFGAVGVVGGFGDFFERVPGLAVGAFAEPFGVHGAAVTAEEVGFGFGHGVNFRQMGREGKEI